MVQSRVALESHCAAEYCVPEAVTSVHVRSLTNGDGEVLLAYVAPLLKGTRMKFIPVTVKANPAAEPMAGKTEVMDMETQLALGRSEGNEGNGHLWIKCKR